jgi:hypothetical protein
MFDPYIDIATSLVDAWRRGTRFIRVVLFVSICLVAIAIVIVSLAEAGILNKQIATPIGGGLGVASALMALAMLAYRRALEREARVSRIEEVERRVIEDPKATQAAWELAQVKLENYLNRNLQQVWSIYWLTIIVMTIGFGLIGYGVFMVYQGPQNLTPSILAAVSGVLVNFIGASFLIVYRSTMEQAKEYVVILERINAVGMAVQILESIEDVDLRKKVMAEVAKELLSMYRARTTGARKSR